jgi:hypothetical protein
MKVQTMLSRALPAVVLLTSASLGLAAESAGHSVAQVTPLQKVVTLLDGMLAKGKKEKHEEEVEFAKFQAWCDDTRFNAEKSIEEGTNQITQLEADIAKNEADAESAAQEISELEAQIASAQSEHDSAQAIRAKEHEDFMSQNTDYAESIDAIERAIATLKAKKADVAQTVLLQVQGMPMIPDSAKATIRSFLALDQESGDGVPEANAYENQSGGVVDLLEKLRLKFQDQKLALEKAEMNSKSNFQVLMQKLTDNIVEFKKTTEEKTAFKGSCINNAATAKGDLEVTTKTKAEDEKTLSDTNGKCKMMSEEFENNQVVRSGEIEAIEKATEILSSDAVSGNAEKHLPKLIQLKAGKALMQLRGENDDAARARLVAFLQGRAKSSGSKYLALVAAHAASDPFAKVKTMIKDLITKLMEEANSEADHKAYCDTEMATNKQTREIKQSEVDELSASIDKNTADSTELTEQIAQLSDALAALSQEQATATKIRGEEKATNTATIADATEAQLAVEKATAVLKEFYGSVASSSALLQGGAGIAQEMKQAAQAPYKGQQAENGGIMGFLEVVLSDFARLEAETSTAEDQAQSAYSSFMDESNEDKAVKEATSEHKTGKKQQTDEKIRTEKKELELTQGELDAALEYYEKLKPDCVDQALSYQDRVAQREAEIQSLQEALAVL